VRTSRIGPFLIHQKGKTMTWTRRTFLKTLGLGAGAALLSPFYSQVFAAGGTPRRFVIFVEGNGIEPHNFLSTATASALEAAGAQDLGSSRQLYKSYRHDSPVLTASSGLSDAPSLASLQGGSLQGANGELSLEEKSAVLLGLSSKITGGGHSTETGALSCTRSPVGSPTDMTVDHYLASLGAVRNDAPFAAVRLGVVGGSTRLNYSTCAFGPNQPAPITCDPTAAFNSLFGSVASGAGAARFSERRELLDFAVADVDRALASFSGNSVERQKLERYLESLENMVDRQETIQEMQNRLSTVKPPEPGESALYTSESPLDRLQSQVDMATAALIGGLTNVVVIALGTGAHHFALEYPSLIDLYPDGDMLGGHDARHAAEHGNESFVNLLTTITDRQVSMMSSMARSLEQTPEATADGTMLDHTLMLYMSDNGEKHHSRAEEWPILLMGGGALGFKTDGRSVVYPANGNDHNRQVSNLFNCLGHAAGSELNAFGGEGNTRIAEGPLSDIWG
jgi:hypothetical protein